MFDFIVIEFCQSNGNNNEQTSTPTKEIAPFYSSPSIRPMRKAPIQREVFMLDSNTDPIDFLLASTLKFILFHFPMVTIKLYEEQKNWIKIFDSSALWLKPFVCFANLRIHKVFHLDARKNLFEIRIQETSCQLYAALISNQPNLICKNLLDVILNHFHTNSKFDAIQILFR